MELTDGRRGAWDSDVHFRPCQVEARSPLADGWREQYVSSAQLRPWKAPSSSWLCWSGWNPPNIPPLSPQPETKIQKLVIILLAKFNLLCFAVNLPLRDQTARRRDGCLPFQRGSPHRGEVHWEPRLQTLSQNVPSSTPCTDSWTNPCLRRWPDDPGTLDSSRGTTDAAGPPGP